MALTGRSKTFSRQPIQGKNRRKSAVYA